MSNLLLDLVLKSLAIAAFGLCVASLLRKSSAATRHLVLMLTMSGLLILPAVDLLAPRWQVPFLKVAVAANQPAPSFRETRSDVPPRFLPAQNDQTNPSVPALAIWGSIGLLCLTRIGLRLARLRRLEARLDMADDPVLQSIVSGQCRRSGRHVLLLEGAPNEPPMTWGHFRPVLLLPSDAGAWQSERLHSVVLHELAHIERGDWLASIVSQLTSAIYWFNPFVWMISARMARESESAADDRVLGQGLSASQYATHLLEVLRELRGSKAAAEAALAMARPGSLDGRVRAILEERRCRRPARGMAAIGLVFAMGGFAILVAAAGPSIVREAQAPRSPAISVHTESQVATRQETVATKEPKTLVSQKKPVGAVRAPMIQEKPIVVGRPAPTNHRLSITSGSNSAVLETGPAGSTISLSDSDAASTMADVDDGVREAQNEVRKLLADAQKQLEEAKKSGATAEHLKVAEDAVKMGTELAASTLRTVQPLIQSAVKNGLKSAFEGLKKPPKEKPDKPKPDQS